MRATLQEIHAGAALGGADGKSLLYGGDTFSVVYFRAGYTPTDFPGEVEWAARELLERSGAVKSPSAAMHLAGCKKVQQVLAAPGVLEKFVPAAADAAEMRRVFAGLYALDGEGAGAAVARGLADPDGFVLKPQREGGGNNLYGEELAAAGHTRYCSPHHVTKCYEQKQKQKAFTNHRLAQARKSEPVIGPCCLLLPWLVTL